MRVALVIHGFPPVNMAGSEIYTYNLALELAKRHEVFIFYRTADVTRPEYDIEKFDYKGLHITAVNNNFKNCPDFSWTYKNEQIAKKFGAFLDEVSPHVVHFHHLTCLSTTCVGEAKKRNIPTLYTLHDFWLMCQRGQLLNNKLSICAGPDASRCSACLASQLATGAGSKKISATLKKNIPSLRGGGAAKEILKKAYLLYSKTFVKNTDETRDEIERRSTHIKKVCSEIDRFISPSEFVRDKFVEFGVDREKITYLDNGFEKGIFEGLKRKKSKKIRFGYIGSWIPSKGVHVLIKAFNRVSNDTSVLKIYGKLCAYDGYNDYGEDLARLIENKNITLEGEYDNKDVGKILSGIDVLIVPSIWYENSPLTVHEAFLAGVPVIASNIGGLAEYVREGAGGLNFTAGDDEDLYKKIRSIIENPALTEEMRKKLPEVKSIAENAAELEEIYEELRAPSIPEGYDFIRNIFNSRSKRMGERGSTCAYKKYKQKELVNISTIKVKGEPRRVLFEHPTPEAPDTSTRVSFRGLKIERDLTLDFAIGINEEAWDKPGDGVEFELLVREEGKEKAHSIFKKYIDPKSRAEDRRWFDESIALSAYSGRSIELIIKTSAGPRGDTGYDWAGWSGLSIRDDKEEKYNLIDRLSSAFILLPHREDPIREDVLYLGDDSRQVVSLEKNTKLIYNDIDVPAGSRLKLGVAGSKKGLEVEVRTAGTKETIFTSNTLGAISNKIANKAWHDVEVDLNKYGGKVVNFHFRNTSGLEVALGPLEIISNVKRKIKRHKISHTNVLFITLDAVRADRMGFMGNKIIKTPNMDRMAAEGVIFKNHFAQSHITIPSHLSLLSSKYPRSIKTMDNYQYNLPPLNTIAERLGEHDYKSSAVVSVSLLNPGWCRGIERGFTDFFPVLGRERTASQGVNILAEWIKEHREKPFFSWIHLYDAHFPYQAPQPFHKMYEDSKSVNNKEAKEVKSVEMHASVKEWLTKKGISTVDAATAEYGAEITYLDNELGRLFKSMDSLDVLDSTLVVITADHGECLGERGGYFSHMGVYDETMHIPLIMSLPGSLPSGKSIHAITMNTDLVPTALNILGLPADNMEGKSLLPLIKGETAEVHEYVIDEGGHGAQVALRTKKWKYIKTLEDITYQANFKKKKGDAELYDIKRDRGELNNVIDDNVEAAARLESLLAKWLAKRSNGAKAEQIAADEDTKKQLKALGYL